MPAAKMTRWFLPALIAIQLVLLAWWQTLPVAARCVGAVIGLACIANMVLTARREVRSAEKRRDAGSASH
jgi:hypothetical protein